jgi:hypothetical protein
LFLSKFDLNFFWLIAQSTLGSWIDIAEPIAVAEKPVQLSAEEIAKLKEKADLIWETTVSTHRER